MWNKTLSHPEEFSALPFEPSTLVELLRWRALEQPDQLAYIFLGDEGTEEVRLTYSELDRKARAIAALLQSLGVDGGRALLLYPSGLDYIAAFFGCQYAGAVAVPAYPPRPTKQNRNLPRVRAIVNDCQPFIALSTSQIISSVEGRIAQSPELQAMRWQSTDKLRAGLEEEWQEPSLSTHSLSFLQYTSGSTALPKGVMVSHGNLLHNERLIKLAFQQSERSMVVGWLPLYHDMGLIGNVLQPLYLGATCLLMSPTSFLLRPFRWLQAISQYKATTSGGPNFAYELCVRKITAEQRDRLDLSTWSTAFNGAEPIRHETMERFVAAFGPCGFRREAFAACYGLAEATLIVSGGLRDENPSVLTVDAPSLERNQIVPSTAGGDSTRTLVGCGVSLLEQQIVIVDPATANLCAPETVGEIWVSGASVTHGYWNRPEETAQTFHAYLAETGEGPFLRTGDLGFIHDGQLYVTGRLKDLIVIRGRNLYPQDIELTVERSHPAVRPGCGAALGIEIAGEERLVVLQEVETRQRPDANEIIENIRQAISEDHEVLVHAVVLINPGRIPKTSSGKIQRHACRAQFLAESFDAVGAWRSALTPESEGAEVVDLTSTDNAEAIESWVISRLARSLGVESSEVDVNQLIARYSLDSLQAIELIHSFKETLGVSLPMTIFLQGSTIAQVMTQILAQMKVVSASTKPLLTAAPEEADEYPLSHGQQSMWFLHQLAPESAAYNLMNAVRIRSHLDTAALRRSFQALVDRHASLRTTFSSAQGKPVQRIHAHMEVSFVENDAAAWSEQSLNERLIEEAHRPFDLEQGPLMRVNLFKHSAEEHTLLLTAHHIVVDFWSFAVLVSELGSLYPAECAGESAPLAPLAMQYTDYTRWHSEMLLSGDGERLWSYWQKQLAGILPVLNLPFDRLPQPIQTYHGNSHAFKVRPDIAQGLKALSRSHEATLYMTLLAAFQVLLHRYTEQKDILVGSPTAVRSQVETAGMVGYFVNPLVMRADLSGDPTFTTFLQQVRQTVLAALEHQEYPFHHLVEQLQTERDVSRPPIFQVMFTLQKAHLMAEKGLNSFALGEAGARMKLGELELESIAIQQRIAQFDLTLMMAETDEELTASLQYNSDLFDAGTIARIARHFEVLLESIVARPEQAVTALPLLPPTERHQLLVQWNQTEADYPRHTCIHQLFEAQAQRTPEAVALICEEVELSYGELNRRANQVAHYLRGVGVEAEASVGICMERSVEMVVALLGILKAGGAYVPLDPTYPKERVAFMVANAHLPVLLTQQSLLESLPGSEAKLICLDSDWAAIATQPQDNPDSGVTAENLAYVIYTSGSTGQPKGVCVPHRTVVNFFHAMDAPLGGERPGVWLALTSMSFDISVLELFWTLARGYRVVVQREQETGFGAGISASRVSSREMQFSLFYFASEGADQAEDRYKLLLESAKFADRQGFTAVWTPERHFHAFGDLYANPSVTGAALAAVTQRIQIRAGSVVLPLHNPIRVAEEWAMVDNLSNGRVGISFASGWHADDFVFAPDNYAERKEIMSREIETVRRLWRGEAISFRGGAGNDVPIRIMPRPVQTELPFWVTAAGSPETFQAAGAMGSGLLTHLLGQSIEELAEKIGVYKQAWREHGHPPGGEHVTLMLHTFVAENLAEVREKVRQPFINYLRSSLGLIRNLAKSLGKDIDSVDLTEDDMEAVLAHAFDRYFETSGLLGTPDSCLEVVERLRLIGVNEVACLIDFGVDFDSVMSSLHYLDEVRQRSNEQTQKIALDYSLTAQVQRHQVTHMQCTPSLVNMLSAENGALASLVGVRKLLLGGEALPLSLARQLKESLPAELHNMYGPTETTIWSARHEVRTTEGSTVPIGRPISNTQIFILNANLEPVPIGVAGEVYIGGEGVVRGYLKRPELTAERFIPAPFSAEPGARMYRAGDVARYLPDGKIEFLGRRDQQVKLRGYRIELEEIEAVLRQHEQVREAVVIARQDGRGQPYLAGYVVGQPPSIPTVAELREYLRQRLPDYMVPGKFALLEELPLTPNGKLDRQALPEPEQSRAEACGLGSGPKTPIEEVVAGIWGEVLEIEQVDVEDNFFELGGHSLLATQLMSRVRESFGVELALRKLFEAPTVAGLAAQIEQELGGSTSEPAAAIVRREREGGEAPLSFAQQRLWFLDQLDPGSPAYNNYAAVRLTGPLHHPALEQTFSEILRRHEVLRTHFVSVGGNPLQRISPVQEIELEVLDLSSVPETRREIEAQELLAAEARRPFDLSRGPLLRAQLLRLWPDHHLLLFTMHHIVSDGWSMGVLVREIAALYAAFSRGEANPLPPLPIQYADYALWQREWLSGQRLADQLSYWQEQLTDAPVLELPTDYPRPAVRGLGGAQVGFRLPARLSEELRKLSRREGATLYMVLLAAFKVLLWRYSGQADVVVGTAIAGRTRGEVEDLIGFFVNTLAVRTQVEGRRSFREQLGHVREKMLQSYGHQEVPFEMVVEAVQPERRLSHTPLFQVMFAWENTGAQGLELAGLGLEMVEVETATAKFDITLAMSEEGGESLGGKWEYSEELFAAETIKRMSEHYQSLLESIVAQPEQPVSLLPMITAAERQQSLVQWNDNGRDYPQHCIHQMFQSQAQRTPDAVALIFDEQQLTYRELDRRSNQVAAHLQTLGMGPELLVGICMERSTEMVVGLLGILKTGAAYVPLDPFYPKERIAFMMSDAGLRLLLTQERLLARLPESDVQVLCLDRDAKAISSAPTQHQASHVTAENLAYVIYTSGSTGQPKGVCIEHRSVSTFIQWSLDLFSGDELRGVLASTSICFDLSVFELFVPLACGGTVILAEHALHLPKLAAAAQVTLINTVPSAIAELIRTGTLPESVLTVNLAGEPLKRALVEQVYRQQTIERVLNLYGPSEDTTYSTWSLMERGSSAAPTIGSPIANTQVYILDAAMQPVPVGVPGEVYLGGEGLARGYLNRAELTAEKFIPDLFSYQSGARLYRTGDLARYRPDGQLDFLGRRDHQVKVRGYRIELGEVETALLSHAQVREAIVVVRQESGDKRLVAYLVTDATPTVSQLREHLKEKLPDYMVPSAFVMLGELPLTPNGKVDRRALPEVESRRPELGQDYVRARSGVEEQMAGLWGELLGVAEVGVEDNFFELGGHSLLATQLMSRVRESFGVELALRKLFEAPTVAALAVMIEEIQLQPNGSETSKIKSAPRGGSTLEDLLAKVSKLSEVEVSRMLRERKPLDKETENG